MVEVTSCWLDGSGCWTDYEDGYAGQVHWEWKVARIESTNPLYDFYAVYLLYSIGPSSWTGNPNPGSIEWAEYRTTDASVNMDLLAGQEVATYKPDTTQGSSSASYGVSVGVSRTGPDASFTASVDYTKPDVTISPHTDWNWAGFQSWSMGFGGAPSCRSRMDPIFGEVLFPLPCVLQTVLCTQLDMVCYDHLCNSDD